MEEQNGTQLEELKKKLQNIPYIQYNGMVIDRMEPDSAAMHVEMRHEFENPYGMAHGGLLFTLIDTTAGTTARADGRRYLTLNANVNYLRSGKGSGRITSCGRIVHRGRTTAVVDVDVRDEEDRLLCTGTVTMFCLDGGGSAAAVTEPDSER